MKVSRAFTPSRGMAKYKDALQPPRDL